MIKKIKKNEIIYILTKQNAKQEKISSANVWYEKIIQNKVWPYSFWDVQVISWKSKKIFSIRMLHFNWYVKNNWQFLLFTNNLVIYKLLSLHFRKFWPLTRKLSAIVIWKIIRTSTSISECDSIFMYLGRSTQ